MASTTRSCRWSPGGWGPTTSLRSPRARRPSRALSRLLPVRARAPATCGPAPPPASVRSRRRSQAAAAAGYDLTPTRPVLERLAGGLSRQAARSPQRTVAQKASASGGPNGTAVSARSGRLRASASTSPSSAASTNPRQTARGRARPLRPPAAWRRQAPALRGRAAAGRPSQCRPSDVAGAGARQRRRERRARQQAEPGRATRPATISGSVRTSGSSQLAGRSAPAPAATSRAGPCRPEGWDGHASARAPIDGGERSPPADRKPAARRRNGGSAAGRAASSITGTRSRAWQRRRHRPGTASGPSTCRASRPVRAARACRRSYRRTGPSRPAEDRERRALRARRPARQPPGGRRQSVGVRRGLIGGTDQRLRIGHGGRWPGWRNIGPWRIERIGTVARLQRLQPRAQLLADVARVLGVADHPRREEDDQLGTVVDVAGVVRTGCRAPGISPSSGTRARPGSPDPGSGRPAPRSGRSGR